jgi:multimeric flavodoxin WrbA
LIKSQNLQVGRGAVLACSARAGGNSDLAAALFTEGLRETSGDAHILNVRDYPVSPCTACLLCEQGVDRCPAGTRDKSESIFQELFTAPLLCIASPIYFYHLPGIFKLLIDRGQFYYSLARNDDQRVTSLPQRKAYAVLVAGRPTGERLFEGSLLTLRYFLEPFRIQLAEPLLLRGLDAPGDLAEDAEARQMILDYGRAAALETAWSGT